MQFDLLAEEEFGGDELDSDTLAEIERLASEANADQPPAAMNFDGDTAADVEAAAITDTLKEETYKNDDTAPTDTAPEVKPTKKARRPRADAEKKRTVKAEAVALDKIVGKKEAEAITTAINSLAIKVTEKANNVIEYVRGERSVCSVYTIKALNELREKNVMTSAAMVELFRGLGYKEGTARSQGQQQMMLLPALGLATRAGNTLTLKTDAKLFSILITKIDGVELREAA